MKKCTICGEEKPYTEFHRQASREDGYCSWCKPCKSERKREAYNSNRGHVLSRMAEYRKANKEKVAATKRECYQRNAAQYKAKHRDYYLANAERKKTYQSEYVKRNWASVKQVSAAYKRNRLRNDPLFRAEYAMRCRVFQAFRKKAIPQSQRTRDMLGCEWETLKAHMEAQFAAGMTWNNYGEWHVDHIVPLASATSESELIRLCHYSNLQPLWAADNRRKGARLAA